MFGPFFGYFLNYFLFLSLLNLSVNIEVQDLLIKKRASNFGFLNIDAKFTKIGPAVTSILMGQISSKKELLEDIVNKKLSFYFYEWDFIDFYFSKEALPYILEAYKKIQTDSPYDLGCSLSLTYLIRHCSDGEIVYPEKYLDREARYQFYLEQIKKKFRSRVIEPLIPNKRTVWYIGSFLKIPKSDLVKIFGIENIYK